MARARRARDRSCPGVGLARLRIAVASGIITEFGQRSGAEDRSQAGQARDDLRIRVLLESGGEFSFERGDLRVQLADNTNQRAHNHAVGAGDRRCRLQLRRTQRRLNLSGTRGHSTVTYRIKWRNFFSVRWRTLRYDWKQVRARSRQAGGVLKSNASWRSTTCLLSRPRSSRWRARDWSMGRSKRHQPLKKPRHLILQVTSGTSCINC